VYNEIREIFPKFIEDKTHVQGIKTGLKNYLEKSREYIFLAETGIKNCRSGNG